MTVHPTEQALDRVLNLPGLRSLFIQVLRPNADTSSPAARQRVEARLKSAHAQKLEERWFKAADAERLVPSQEILETAGVAAEVGVVHGIGRNANGEKTEASTQHSPRRYVLGASLGETLFSKLKNSLKSRF